MAIVNSYLILPSIALVIFFLKMKTYFMKITQNIKRLEGVGELIFYLSYLKQIKTFFHNYIFNVQHEVLYTLMLIHRFRD